MKKYDRTLEETLHKGSPRQKALVVSNSHADRAVFGTSPLTRLDELKIRDSVGGEADSIRYNKIIHAEKRLTAHLGNVQTRYLRLRERCASLGGLFTLFKQNAYFVDLLNDLLWEHVEGQRLQEELIAHGHVGLGRIRHDDEEGSFLVCIDISDEGRAAASEHIAMITEQTRGIKSMIAAARDFMEERAVRLHAYEQYLNGIEDEIGETIRRTKCRLYEYDTEGWEQLRGALIETGYDLLELMEALPDYEALSPDEVTYQKSVALLNDGRR